MRSFFCRIFSVKFGFLFIVLILSSCSSGGGSAIHGTSGVPENNIGDISNNGNISTPPSHPESSSNLTSAPSGSSGGSTHQGPMISPIRISNLGNNLNDAAQQNGTPLTDAKPADIKYEQGIPISSLTKVCSGSRCLTFADWAAGIDERIHQQAVGYEYLILYKGAVVAQNTFGSAHTDADLPTLALVPSLRMNIASVSKTLTATAALKLLAEKNVSIDSPIYPYLPKSWTFGPNVQTITFRELLTHTSGIRSDQDLATAYGDLRNLIAQGINLNDKVPHYQNHNFALFRILIPYLNGFDSDGMSDPLGSLSNVGQATSLRYLEYMNSVYGNYFRISCTPASDDSSRILSYPYPAGAVHGIDWGDWMETCGGGGLQLSVHEMAIFLNQLNAKAFLSPSQLQLMYENLLGWDYSFNDNITITNPFINDTKHGRCLVKNGVLMNGTSSSNMNGAASSNGTSSSSGTAFSNGTSSSKETALLSTLMVYCPDTELGFVGLANSTLGPATLVVKLFGISVATTVNHGIWDDIVQNAYNAAWKTPSFL